MEWMLDIQLGRRNLSLIQRIAIAEKYRNIYEKQAKENQLSGLKNQSNYVLPNLVKRDSIDTTKKLAEVADVKSSIRGFSEKQVIKVKNSDVHNMHFRKLNNAGENFLTESGVYKLIFKSRKPEAERFSNWVTDEVLPTIRKHGAYMTQQTLEKALTSPDFLIKLATQLKSEQEESIY